LGNSNAINDVKTKKLAMPLSPKKSHRHPTGPSGRPLYSKVQHKRPAASLGSGLLSTSVTILQPMFRSIGLPNGQAQPPQ
jgi:hypothetical protein